jgi:hypothetical protein
MVFNNAFDTINRLFGNNYDRLTGEIKFDERFKRPED